MDADIARFTTCKRSAFPALKERLENEGFAVFGPIPISKGRFDVTYMRLNPPLPKEIYEHTCNIKEFSWIYNCIVEEDATVFDLEVLGKSVRFKYLRNCDRHLIKKT